jgi:hypothetical protein
MGRAVAFDMNFQPKPVGGNFRGRYQFEIVLDLSTGGMKTHRRPSRGSTEIAVRTAPPRSPMVCSMTLLRGLRGVNWAPPDAGMAARESAKRIFESLE